MSNLTMFMLSFYTLHHYMQIHTHTFINILIYVCMCFCTCLCVHICKKERHWFVSSLFMSDTRSQNVRYKLTNYSCSNGQQDIVDSDKFTLVFSFYTRMRKDNKVIPDLYNLITRRRSPRSVVANRLDCSLEVSEFELQSSYYVNFLINTDLSPRYRLNSTTTVLLKECL